MRSPSLKDKDKGGIRSLAPEDRHPWAVANALCTRLLRLLSRRTNLAGLAKKNGAQPDEPLGGVGEKNGATVRERYQQNGATFFRVFIVSIVTRLN